MKNAKCRKNDICLRTINPFRHTFSDLRRPRAMADPSTAAARLQVLGMSCDLTGSLPATRLHSDRSGFDRLKENSL